MANTIKIKRNITNNDAPTTSDIAKGEIGFTEGNQKLYYRDNSDNIRVIGGEGAFLRSDTNDTMSGNLTVTGDLTVNGSTTTVNSSTLTVDDPIVRYADNNSANSVDIGFYGKYVDDATTKYAGLVRDASDSGKFILFANNQAEPTTTVNTSGTGHATATLKANIEGNLAGSPTITAATVASSLDMNGNELILDADGDTSISSSVDDVIRYQTGNTARYYMGNTALYPAANNTYGLGSSSLRWANVYGVNGNFTNTTVSSQMTSTVATGTAPMVIASTTKVANLNADLLDDQTGSYYLNYNNFTNTPTVPTNNNQLTNGAAFITASSTTTFSNKTIDGGTF